MQISKSTCCALSICAAIVMLAGCNTAANLTPTQSAGLAPNVTPAVRTVAHGFTELHRCRLQCRNQIETLTSTTGSGGITSCGVPLGSHPDSRDLAKD